MGLICKVFGHALKRDVFHRDTQREWVDDTGKARSAIDRDIRITHSCMRCGSVFTVKEFHE